MKITKSTCEIYKLQPTDFDGWAAFTIDEGVESGRIQIASDYGDWQYYWSHCGEPFKKFLTKLDMDYVARKFDADRHFDSEKTIKEYKRSLSTDSEYLNKNTKKAIKQEIASLEYTISESQFILDLERSCPELMRQHGYAPPMMHSINPLFKIFWKKCWKPFMTTLKKEIKGAK